MAEQEIQGYQPDDEEIRIAEENLTDEQKRQSAERIIETLRKKAEELGIGFESDPKAQVEKKIRGWDYQVVERDGKTFFETKMIAGRLEKVLANGTLPGERVILAPHYNKVGLPALEGWKLWEHPEIYVNYETTDPHPMVEDLRKMGLGELKVVSYPEGNEDEGFPVVIVNGKKYEATSGGLGIRDKNFQETAHKMIKSGEGFATPVDENPFEWAVIDHPRVQLWNPYEEEPNDGDEF